MPYSRLRETFGDRLLRDEPLAKYTAARLGGPADALVLAESVAELIFAANFAWAEDVPYRILGAGANVLAADEGFRGLIILNRATQVRFIEDGFVRAESGANFSSLARRCMRRGLGGLEWAVNVPGTVGGAVINNAGAHGSDMAGSVRQVTVHQPGSVENWSLVQLRYGYRTSALKGSGERYLVTAATLSLTPGYRPAELQAVTEEFIAHRKRTQPPGASLGSIFKNPSGDYAGRLIEVAGLKGRQIGGVQISPIHANFFVNLGEGTAADYRALIQLARQTVQARFGVTLELEIELM